MIRHAEEADLTRLTEIELKANRVFPVGRIPDVDDAIPIADLKSAMAQALLFVACDGEQVVGYAMCHVEHDVVDAGDQVLYLDEVAVDPEFGRRGIGRNLVEFIVAESRRRNLIATALTTFGDLPFNGPFYESVGFQVIGESELTPRLAGVLATEKRQGFVNRVAMKLVNET